MSLETDQHKARIRRGVLASGVITTLMIWTSIADPINLPKMFILCLAAAWILGGVVTGIISDSQFKFSLGQSTVGVLILGILVSAFVTDVRYTAFYGAFQRNDGAWSYIALAILTFAAMFSFEITDIAIARKGLLILGVILTFYAVLQATNNDPMPWVLVYGPVIGTLGNPDFMSAILGTSSIVTLGYVLSEKKMILKYSGSLLLLLEIFMTRKTGSVQGIMVMAVGFTILAIVKIWQWKKIAGLCVIVLSGLTAIPVSMGFMNKGPLAAHIYRSSMQSRLDYWHAAVNAFKAHSLFGVGLDRFGESYGQYAVQHQIVQGQMTNNAHNVFLQLLATGGLLLFIPYILLLGVIFSASLRKILSSRGQEQFDVASIFAVWFGLLLISVISIDNLGVAVWFWILGGILYGMSKSKTPDHEMTEKKTGNNAKGKKPLTKQVTNRGSLLSPVVSLGLLVLALTIMVPAWKTSSTMMDIQHNKSGLDLTGYVENLKTVASRNSGNVDLLAMTSNLALANKDIAASLRISKALIKADPRSNTGHLLSAIANEQKGDYSAAIPFRVRLLTLDLWSTANMLQLVTDYVKVKDLTQAKRITAKIVALRPDSDDAKAASVLVKG